MAVPCSEKIFPFCFARQKNLSLCRFPKSFILLQNGGLLARKSFFVMRHKIDFFWVGVRENLLDIKFIFKINWAKGVSA